MKSVARLLALAVLLQVLIVMPPAMDSAEGQVTAALAINDASGGEAGGSVVFTVTRSGNTLASVTATYTTVASGSATAGTDYPHPQTGSISFAANDTSEQITIVTTDDAVTEPSETFQVQLTSASPLTASISDGTGIGTIVDDDVFVSIADLSKLEGTGGTTQFGFNVTLAPVSQNPVAVTYATAASGSAIPGTDYQPITGTVMIPAGQSQVAAPVTVTADNIDEGNETFTVNLTAATNARISDGQAVGTIQDDDGPPAISVSDVSRTEGTVGTSPANFTLSLDRASSLPITVTSTTQDRTASAPSDYQTRSEATTFAPGETSKQVPVNVVGDTIDEADESFALLLQSSSNATINDGTGIATILDDDAAPSVSIGDASGAEGTVINFAVSLSAPSQRTVTVTYSTAPGTAGTSDYTHVVRTLVFTPGQVNQTASVSATGDGINESTETFGVNLSSPINTTIADGQAVGTILDERTAPTVSIADATGAEGSVIQFPVTLSSPSGRTVTVTYTTAYDFAEPGTDYTHTVGTVVFSPGQVTGNASVSTLSDSTNEWSETFRVSLSSPINATIGDGAAVGTITNVYTPPQVSVGNASAIEKDDRSSQDAWMVFTLTQSAPSHEMVEVTYRTVDGTAIQGKDFEGVEGTAVIFPGQTTVDFWFRLVEDVEDEDNETFDVQLVSAVNAVIGDGSGTATIVDDDPKISITDAEIGEGGAPASRTAIFNVSLPRTHRTVTVTYATAYGSANADSDYDPARGDIVFSPGETTKPIGIPIRADLEIEGNEFFYLNLTAQNGALVRSQARATIYDDDYEEELEEDPYEEYPMGYWMVARDGGIFTFGDAGFHGSMGGTRLDQGVVGMDSHPWGEGYWLVASDGGVFSFGDSHFQGSMGGSRLDLGMVGMAATPSGEGYWLVAADGGVFTFGDAGFHGSLGGRGIRDVVSIVAHPDGDGYWLFTKGGSSYSFGSAHGLGTRSNPYRSAVGADIDEWELDAYIVDSNGAVYQSNPYSAWYGDMRGQSLAYPMVGMTVAPDGGYWLGAADGGVFSFGVPFLGGMGHVRLDQPIVGIEGLYS